MAEPLPADPRFAIHAYAWTSAWSSEDVEILNRAKRLGLDAVEIPLSDLAALDPAAIRERSAATGIEVVSSTVMTEATDPTSAEDSVREAAVEYLRACIDAAAAMGAPIVSGVTYAPHLSFVDGGPEEVHYERAAEVLREAARYAAPRGVTIGIEAVNRYESFLVNTAAQALDLAERVGEDNVGVHLDAYHMNIEEQGFSEPVRRVVERLIHFHLTESDRGIPGRGNVAWGQIFDVLDAAGYDGFVGLESFAEGDRAMRRGTFTWRQLGPDSDTVVAEGLAYLRGLVGRAGGAGRAR